MVLACKEDAHALGEVSAAAWEELARVTRDLEAAARAAFQFDRINYLALMMVDPHVHFHVLPRYAEPRELGGVVFEDAAWPKPPDVTAVSDCTPDSSKELPRACAAAGPRTAAVTALA